MTASLPAELPDGIERREVAAADHMERLETPDGRAYYVIAHVNGERELANADVVEYETIDHPVLTGAVGFLALLTALLAPFVYGYQIATELSGTIVPGAVAIGGAGVGWFCSSYLLQYTILGEWVYRLLEWNDHKVAIMASDAQ